MVDQRRIKGPNMSWKTHRLVFAEMKENQV